MNARVRGRTVKVDETQVLGGAAALGKLNGRHGRTVDLDAAENMEKEAEAGSDGSQFQPGLRGRKLPSGAAAIIHDAPRVRLPIAGPTKGGFTRSGVGNPTPVPTLDGATVRFTVPMSPVGKPTMTRSDQWRVGERARPCVQAYRDWCDAIRAAADHVAWPPVLQGRILVVSYLSIPPSYSAQQQATLPGLPHQVKPDADNIVKGILDALFENDSFIYDERGVKLYDDGQGPRSEVSLA